MKIVVPLAGPDFEYPDGRLKAEKLIDGQPLLRRALESRPWWKSGKVGHSDLIFVLKDSPNSRRFVADQLAAWYPAARSVLLGAYAQGAAMSALAGVALVAHTREVICIDLVDILYETSFDIETMLRKQDLSGVGLVFSSTNPIYSYFKTNELGRVVEVAEKKVISQHASVGTYFFATPQVYLNGVASNLASPDKIKHQDLFYVCPVMQGILDAGFSVGLQQVENVRDLKLDLAALT